MNERKRVMIKLILPTPNHSQQSFQEKQKFDLYPMAQAQRKRLCLSLKKKNLVFGIIPMIEMC